MPGFRALHEKRRIPAKWDPSWALCGTEEVDGRKVFKTARAKEYPSALCALLAESLLEGSARRKQDGNYTWSATAAMPAEVPDSLLKQAAHLRRCEREAGDVQMGADFARGGRRSSWVPKLQDPDLRWMPSYPASQDNPVLRHPPTVLGWHYDGARQDDAWWDPYW